MRVSHQRVYASSPSALNLSMQIVLDINSPSFSGRHTVKLFARTISETVIPFNWQPFANLIASSASTKCLVFILITQQKPERKSESDKDNQRNFLSGKIHCCPH